jgi:hypothetical protein
VRSVLNDPAALPLLQFTLTELWRQRKGKRKTGSTGNSIETVGRPTEAVARKAEKVYKDLRSEENQEAARAILPRARSSCRRGGTRPPARFAARP